MMKSLLLATAAVATFAAAPALAQDAAGSIGVQYSEADFGAPAKAYSGTPKHAAAR